MNEIEKAIKVLNAIKRHIQMNANKVGAYDMMAYGVISEDIDSIDLAISALEKQIPKPRYNQNTQCRICFYTVLDQDKYCPNCGQKLEEV